jgi:syndecan 4
MMSRLRVSTLCAVVALLAVAAAAVDARSGRLQGASSSMESLAPVTLLEVAQVSGNSSAGNDTQLSNGTATGGGNETGTSQQQAPRPLANVCPLNCSSNGYCLEGQCFCRTGWQGAVCDQKVCPNDCSLNGQCVRGSCVCNPGFFGDACHIRGCLYNCNGNGYCHDQTCVCFDNYMGVFCEDEKGCPSRCNAPNGECREGRCYCKPGWTGEACSDKICPNECSSHGECNPKTGVCKCDANFYSEDCSKRFCPSHCSGRGICDPSTGNCTCSEGFFGANCAPTNCKNNCSDHGKCLISNETGRAFCSCEKGWSGVGCEKEVCPNMCNEAKGHGECTTYGCKCKAEWGDDDCSRRRCPYDCSGADHGACDREAGWKCACLTGWNGEACQERTCDFDCLGHGVCNNGTCECRDWWSGRVCHMPVCKNDCSKQGQCVLPAMDMRIMQAVNGTLTGVDKVLIELPLRHMERAHCLCDMGFAGSDCAKKACKNDCNGRGVCEGGVCFCNSGFFGEDCSAVESVDLPAQNKSQLETARERCEAHCFHGKCLRAISRINRGIEVNHTSNLQDVVRNSTVEYECYCEPEWSGPSCDRSLTRCPPQCIDSNGVCARNCTGSALCPVRDGKMCSGRGSCNEKGECECEPPFVGIDCGTATCPNNCNGKGLCNTKTQRCLCFAGWAGVDCSQKVFADS